MNVFVSGFFVVLISLNVCTGLYEDQVGKFEWRQQYIGKLKYSHVDITSPIKKVIVATEQNVLSALSLKTGEIVWRQVLEQDEIDNIQFMGVGSDVITISGIRTPIVRAWDIDHGYLMGEWLAPKQSKALWAVLGPKLIQVDIIDNSHIDITAYNSFNGNIFNTQKVTGSWIKAEKCVLQNNIIVCNVDGKSLQTIRLLDGTSTVNIKVDQKSVGEVGSLKKMAGVGPAVIVVTPSGSEKVVQLSPQIEVVDIDEKPGSMIVSTSMDQQLLFAVLSHNKQILDVKTVSADGDPSLELTSHLSYPSTMGALDSVQLICQPKKDHGVACRILLSTEFHSISLAQHPANGDVLWTREESLASIVNVEMVDLPVSETDAAIEKEFGNKEYGFVGAFFRRLVSQALQLQNLVLTIAGIHSKTIDHSPGEELIRDDFGLHKFIVAVTSAGKVFGIDNLSGKIAWQFAVSEMQPFSVMTTPRKHVLPLYVLRTARHLPYQAQCALLAKRRTTGEGLLVRFNPITGELVEPPKPLGIRVRQALLLSDLNEEFSKVLAVLDEHNSVHVYPDGAVSEVTQNTPSFIFTADPETGVLTGFSITFHKNKQPTASKMWEMRVGNSGEKILAVVGKDPMERVHSQGRVMADRSVMYKYVNPNLVAVATQGFHPSHKVILNIYLVDVVTGTVVFSVSHRRARGPLHIVHSENWLVYAYISDKNRRTEISSLEMYEGKSQSNATAFSSLDSVSLLPLVERQSYILGANVMKMKDTVTEKGITSKHILIALSNGGVLQLPWMYVDPRRPLGEPREEAVIPYAPELPIPFEAMINHNQTVMNVRDIHTSVSGLESTCLVFVHGLDLFYTRVAPSKTFDLLKEDFDYFLITLVLLALCGATYLTKRLASRKALKQAWRGP